MRRDSCIFHVFVLIRAMLKDQLYKCNIRIENHENGSDIRDINMLNINKNNILNKINEHYKNDINDDINIIDEINILSAMKSKLDKYSSLIISNLSIINNKKLSNDYRLKACNLNEEVNKKYNELSIEFNNRLKDIFKIFKTNDEESIYYKIFNLIIKDDVQLDVLLDVLTQYEKYIKGERNIDACIKHGINYSESKLNAPKGFFNGMLKK